MFWNLVATVFAGLGAAGIALAIRSLTRKKAPKWIIPVFAGLGMMAYQVYIEYTWFDHMKSRLPAEAEVVSTQSHSTWWRPWSYVLPQITSFTVLDRQSIERQSTDQGEVTRFILYRFRDTYGGRVSEGIHLANCSTGELVPVTNQGMPLVEQMRKLPPDNTLRRAVCS